MCWQFCFSHCLKYRWVVKENVWLNRQQIALLFDRGIKTIGKHIANVLDKELKGFSVVAQIATTTTDVKTYQTEYYNLDVFISVGCRVKSKQERNSELKIMTMQNEIILYQSNELPERIEVRIEDETVWLTQQQMATLFMQTKQNISLHINNCFNENELQQISVVKDSLTTATDGKKYKTKYYNLDVIISVGYRVKSKQGTQFRIWATTVLRDYLLKGYAINQRMNRIENHVENLTEKVNAISLQIQSSAIPNQGVFFDGQVFDAYELASKIIRSATKSIVLIDNYIDENTLTHLSKKGKGVKVLLLTKNTNKQIVLDVQKANDQYGNFTLKSFDKSHDRFLIVDENEVYHVGASLKDLGKKWFAFSKMDKNSLAEILNSILEQI